MHRFLTALAVASLIGMLTSCDDPTSPNSNASLAKNGASDAPSGLGASPVSETEISLAWTDYSRNETGFEVHRSTTGASGTFTQRARVGANAQSYSDKGLTTSTEYCYKVRWYRTQGKTTNTSIFSEVSCTRTLGVPPVPANVAAVPGSEYYGNVWIDVSWADASGTATGYIVERSALPAGPWDRIASLEYWARSYRDGNRAIDAQACYRVTASNSFGSSAPSSVRCTIPPAVPTDVKAASGGAQSVKVSWSASAAADGYEIVRSLDGWQWWTAIAAVPATATSYVDAGLTTGTWYYYRVRARRDGGYSAYSLVARGLAAASAPTSAPVINATAAGSDTVEITWQSIENAEGYRAELTTSNGTLITALGTAASWASAISLPDRSPETTACYRVVAFNGIGDGPASTTDCVTPPARVTNLKAVTAGNGSVGLTWTDPSRVNSGYSLEHLEVWYDYYGTAYEAWIPIADIGDVEAYTVTGLSADQSHVFRLVPLAPDGRGTPSDAAEAYAYFPPAAPSGLTAVAASGRVELQWTDNSTAETFFLILRCEGDAATCGDGAGYSAYDAVAQDVKAYSDTWVQAGRTYWYRVAAGIGAVTSSPSNTVTVTVPAAALSGARP